MAGLGLTKDDWIWLAGVVGLPTLVGGALVLMSRKAMTMSAAIPSKPELRDAGARAFYDVLTVGVNDGDLQYKRNRMKSVAGYLKAFHDAKLLGLSPTELAVSGRYFGVEPEVIKLTVHADGTVHLDDEGRHPYTAAKMAGALAILADVTQLDSAGDPVAERRAPVALL